MKGRPPKPSAMLHLAGTARPSRVRSDEPKFDLVDVFPKPPRTLNADGRKLWNELGPRLVAAGVLQIVDLYPFEQLAYAWQHFRLKAKAGVRVPSADDAALRGLFSEFGMTPAARRRE